MKKVIDQALDLLKVVERFDLEDVELESRGVRLHLSRGAAPVEEPHVTVPVRTVVEAVPAPEARPPEPEDDSRFAKITSPMVGTFYRCPAPDKPPFIEVGQTVEVDQPVCIIEAMKLMNIIKSSVRGKVVKILVENQAPVQASQDLILLEPL